MVRRFCFVLALATVALAQYEVPRKAAEYPAHANWPRFDIGAEYLTHSIPADNGSMFARDYLVVEVAVYPGKEPVMILDAHFTLCINGKKSVLMAESPSFVAASLKYPDWEQPRTLIGTAGTGDGSVIVGAPTPTPRFPGDPTVRPLPRREPDDTDATGQPRPPVNVDDLIARAALPEGLAAKPRKGSLFFAFHGKLKSVRTLDLFYDDTHGNKASLRVFPPGR